MLWATAWGQFRPVLRWLRSISWHIHMHVHVVSHKQAARGGRGIRALGRAGCDGLALQPGKMDVGRYQQRVPYHI